MSGFRNPLLEKLFEEISVLHQPHPQIATTLETIAVILCELDARVSKEESQSYSTVTALVRNRPDDADD